MYDFFSFTKNEMILYHYLYLKGNGNYELITGDFVKMGMAKSSFYDGRDGLIKKGYLKRIASNYYRFNKEGGL